MEPLELEETRRTLTGSGGLVQVDGLEENRVDAWIGSLTKTMSRMEPQGL